MKISSKKFPLKTPVLFPKTPTIYKLPPNGDENSLEKKNCEMFQKG
jgi:hypothetical protein